MTLSLYVAQEVGDSEDTSPAESNTNLYSSFPFGLIFGQPTVKNGTLSQHKGIKVYDNDGKDLDKPRAVYWIPYSCDSLLERGYTCYSCTESLHCMGGNFALKAICGGRRPFCYNGVCSDLRSAKCGGYLAPQQHAEHHNEEDACCPMNEVPDG
ncbi:hypothetical protein ACJJTC_005845 [Scirpophaga incertulas]